jgi:hypothetical protein
MSQGGNDQGLIVQVAKSHTYSLYEIVRKLKISNNFVNSKFFRKGFGA